MDKSKMNFRVVRLTRRDASAETDDLRNFRRLVLSCEELYPGIDRWLQDKVLPGLGTPNRAAFVGYLDENPVISAVVKPGKESKFCHLKISDDLQNLNLGEVFMSVMAAEVRSIAEEVHLTLPESLWEAKREFFKSFGFPQAVPAQIQYRLFDNELRCSASFKAVWKSVLEKLPKIAREFSIAGYSLCDGVLLSIQPEYAEKIMEGKKRIELRKKFSRKWEGERVCFYASRPVAALVGEARIRKINVDKPAHIWETYYSDIGSSKDKFDAYVGTATEIYALELTDVVPYRNWIPISQLTHLLDNDLVPPQSYCSIQNSESWSAAVSVAGLLHGITRNPGAMAL